MKTLTLIGYGNMGSALLSRWLESACVRAKDVSVITHGKAALPKGVARVEWARADVPEMVVLAVKPQQLGEVLAECKARFGIQPLYISIAAGVTSASLAKQLGKGARVVRAMPNTPAKISLGVTALLANKAVSKAEMFGVERLFAAVGTVFWAKNDAQMNAATALTGSGPAYVFALMEAMSQAAEGLGFSAVQADQLVRQMFLGASALAATSSQDLAQLREAVTSKGGTTEAGLQALKKAKLASAFDAVLNAAKLRSEALSI